MLTNPRWTQKEFNMQEILNFIQENADTIIALCALLVSVVSILLGYFSLKSQQKHDRLSVKPIGKISYITSANSAEIEIRNDGTGPMLVSNIKVYENKVILKSNLRDVLPILQTKDDWINMGTQFTIGAGDQKTLLKIFADPQPPGFEEYLQQVFAALEKITLEVEYFDIYDQYIGTLKREVFQRPRESDQNQVEEVSRAPEGTSV
jgi:hypothetical protein